MIFDSPEANQRLSDTAAEAPPATFMDRFYAADKQGQLRGTVLSPGFAVSEDYDRRIKDIKDAGLGDLSELNPMWNSKPTQRAPHVYSEGHSIYDMEPSKAVEDPHEAFQKKLEELAQKFPDKAHIIKADKPITGSESYQAAKKAAEDAASAYGGPPLTGPIADFAGGMWSMRKDPFQVGTLVIGPMSPVRQGAKAVLTMGLKQAAANAALEATMQPFVQSWRKSMNDSYGWWAAAEEIGMAGAFGLGADAGVRMLYRGAQARMGRKAVLDEQGRVVGYESGAASAEREALNARNLEIQKNLEALPKDTLDKVAQGDEEATIALAKALKADEDPSVGGAINALRNTDRVTLDGIDDGWRERSLIQQLRALEDPSEPAPAHFDAATKAERPKLADDAELPRGTEGNQHYRMLDLDGKPVRFEAVDANRITTDPATFQFKGGRDSAGASNALRAVDFDGSVKGKVIVYEREDGSLVVADGHDRVSLANRAPEPQKLDALVFREKDGWTAEQVRAEAARKNIQEGTGSLMDVAGAIRRHPEIVDDSMAVSTDFMADARSIARLSDDAFDAVAGGQFNPKHGVLVSDHVPDQARHMEVLRELDRRNPPTEAAARREIGNMLREPANMETLTRVMDIPLAEPHVIEARNDVLAGVLDAITNQTRLVDQARQGTSATIMGALEREYSESPVGSEIRRALTAVISPAFNEDAAREAVRWAVANGRRDIAEAILARADEAASRSMAAKPGVDETSPKYEQAINRLAAISEQNTKFANEIRGIVNPEPPHVIEARNDVLAGVSEKLTTPPQTPTGKKISDFANRVNSLKEKYNIGNEPARKIDAEDAVVLPDGRPRFLASIAPVQKSAGDLKAQLEEIKNGSRIVVVKQFADDFVASAKEIVAATEELRAIDVLDATHAELTQLETATVDLQKIVDKKLQDGYNATEQVETARDYLSNAFDDLQAKYLDEVWMRASTIEGRVADFNQEIMSRLESRLSEEKIDAIKEDVFTFDRELLPAVRDPDTFPKDYSVLDIIKQDFDQVSSALKQMSDRLDEIIAKTDLDALDDVALVRVLDETGDIENAIERFQERSNKMEDLSSDHAMGIYDAVEKINDEHVRPAVDELEYAQTEIADIVGDIADRRAELADEAGDEPVVLASISYEQQAAASVIRRLAEKPGLVSDTLAQAGRAVAEGQPIERAIDATLRRFETVIADAGVKGLADQPVRLSPTDERPRFLVEEGQPLFALSDLAQRNEATMIDDLGRGAPHPGRVLGVHGTHAAEAAGGFDIRLSEDIGIHIGTLEQARTFSAAGVEAERIASATNRGVSAETADKSLVNYAEFAAESEAATKAAKEKIAKAQYWLNFFRRSNLMKQAGEDLTRAEQAHTTAESAFKDYLDASAIKNTDGKLDIPVILDSKKPLETPDLMDWDLDKFTETIRDRVPMSDKFIERLLDIDIEDHARAANMLRKKIIDAGYDSIRYWNDTEGDGWSYIVIKEGTARSATSKELLYSKVAKPAENITPAKIAELAENLRQALDEATTPPPGRIDDPIKDAPKQVERLREDLAEDIAVAMGQPSPAQLAALQAYRAGRSVMEPSSLWFWQKPEPAGTALMFHATNRSFDKFDLGQSADFGIHFGTAKQAATRLSDTNRLEGGRTIPAEVTVRNAIAMDDQGFWGPVGMATELQKQGYKVTAEEWKRFTELGDAIDQADADVQRIGNSVKPRLKKAVNEANDAIKTKLNDLGIDGIWYKNTAEGRGWSLIVWNEGQVKSATTGEQLFSMPQTTARPDILAMYERYVTQGREALDAVMPGTGRMIDEFVQANPEVVSRIAEALGAPTGRPQAAQMLDQAMPQFMSPRIIDMSKPVLLTPEANARMREIRTAIDETVKMLPPEYRIRVEDSLVFNFGDGDKRLDGLHDGYEKLIYVSMAAGDPVRTSRHEVIHALRQSGLMKDEEFAALYKFADRLGLRKAYEIDTQYKAPYTEAYGNRGGDFVEQLLREETVANMFSDYSLNGRRFGDVAGGGMVDRLIDMIVTFMKQVRDIMGGYGFRNVYDVFESIESGAMARRGMGDAPEASRLAMFAGEKAKTADLDALAKAKQMDSEGKPREAIWTDTGWFKGVDGKWRFEISDLGAGLTKPLDDIRAVGRPMPLDMAFDHKPLFDAYPSARDAEFYPTMDYGPGEASFSAGTPPLIRVGYDDGNKFSSHMKAPSATLHELQHFIQRVGEGDFAKGGTPRLFAQDVKAADQMIEIVNNNLRDIVKMKDAAKTSAEKAELQTRYDNLMSYKLTELVPRAMVDPVAQYRKLAGEVEARAVQTRQKMTPEERRARPPWLDYDVPEADQIVRMANEAIQMSLEDKPLARDLADVQRERDAADLIGACRA